MLWPDLPNVAGSVEYEMTGGVEPAHSTIVSNMVVLVLSRDDACETVKCALSKVARACANVRRVYFEKAWTG